MTAIHLGRRHRAAETHRGRVAGRAVKPEAVHPGGVSGEGRGSSGSRPVPDGRSRDADGDPGRGDDSRSPITSRRGVRTSVELAREARVDADALERLMRHLASIGVLERDGVGRVLPVDNGRGDRAAIIRRELVQRWTSRVRWAVPSSPSPNCCTPCAPASPPSPCASGDRSGMTCRPTPSAPRRTRRRWGPTSRRGRHAIVAARDWGALGHVVDIGGGGGTLLDLAAAGVSRACEARSSICPSPWGRRGAALAAAGLADRSEAVAGSFFDALPARRRGYMLCAILHDWNDEAARAILGRCVEAAGPDGLGLRDREGRARRRVRAHGDGSTRARVLRRA